MKTVILGLALTVGALFSQQASAWWGVEEAYVECRKDGQILWFEDAYTNRQISGAISRCVAQGGESTVHYL